MRNLWVSWNAFLGIGIFLNMMAAFITGFFIPVEQKCTAREVGIGFLMAAFTLGGLGYLTFVASLIRDKLHGRD